MPSRSSVASATRRSPAWSPAGRGASTPAERRALGFVAEATFDEIVDVYVDDELGGASRSHGDRDRRRHRRRQRHRPSRRGGARRRRASRVVLAGRRRGRRSRRPRPSWAAARSPCRATSPIRRRSTRCSTRSRDRFGRLDLLFNNAGIGAPAVPLEDLTLEQWRPSSTPTSPGAFLCTQQAFRLMKRPVAARRADHQQRLDLGHVPRPQLGALHRRPSTRSPASPSRRRSTAGRTTSPAGRSTSATPRTEMTARDGTTGVLQADGRPRAGADVRRRRTSPAPWSTWPPCRSTPTSSS